MKLGIIIQARQGSTRLPHKIVLPFYGEETLLDIIISKLKKLNVPIVLATTHTDEDLELKGISEKHNILFFAGDENNVLKRFIDAAEANSIDVVIRICADNPFIQVDFIMQLIEEYCLNKSNYISFFTKDGLPVIKTHYGFFAELVEVSTLKKVAALTTEKLYEEHVTNFIYSHPEHFEIKKLAFPFNEPSHKIRLTIDTKEDFNIASDLYKKYKEYNASDLVAEIVKSPELLVMMEQQIVVNSK